MEYPLLDENGKPLWPGKYKTKQDIEELRKKIVDEVAWSMEYLLKIVSDNERVVQINWIQRYPDELLRLPRHSEPLTMIIGVDLAISEKETADYTAIVPVVAIGSGVSTQVLVMPHITNKRIAFAEQLDTIEYLYRQMISRYSVTVVVEDVGYQRALSSRSRNEAVG